MLIATKRLWMNFVYLQKMAQFIRSKIRQNFIADHKRGGIGLAGYPSHFVESDSIFADVDSAKLVSVFVEVFLGQVTPRATGFYIKKQLGLIH
jgi:hypothetical protein